MTSCPHRSKRPRSAPHSAHGSPSSPAVRGRARPRPSGSSAPPPASRRYRSSTSPRPAERQPAARGQKVANPLVPPTGRAARRMSESSGLDSSTVHSALGWIPDQGPTVEELDTDLLIVDETSMANLELLVTLLHAVGPDTHVVLVGDADQLAPVGAGKPFAELVEARPVPIAQLT